MPAQVVDLFCGAGGLTHGFALEGIRVRAGIDADPDCRYAFTRNNKARFIKADLWSVRSSRVANLYGKRGTRILAGCAPCQPFSAYSNGRRTKKDRWGLLGVFARLVRSIQPDVVTMENVPQLAKHRVYMKFVQTLHNEDYFVSSKIVSCADYGIPQTRKRLVLLASRLAPISLKLRKAPKKISIYSTIGHLPHISAGQSDKQDPLHMASKLSPLNLRRIKASRPGGSWRDWENSLVAPCHRKKRGRSFPAVYGRMEWNKPAPTITTQFFGFGSGRFGHPFQDRAMTPREAALIQTFPPNYEFVDPKEKVRMKVLGRMIGNAVPVKLARIIARSINDHIREHRV